MNQAFNPYLPNYEYIPDGEPYVFDGRLWIFGSHDRFGALSFCENDYVTWSADVNDLSDWRYEGVIYRRDQDPLNRDGKYPLFAPDVQKGTDGRYYLYYCPCGTDSIGVAVCDTPGGQYEFLGHVKYPDGTILGMKDGDPNMFDPGTLIDDDGQMYLYYGFQWPIYDRKVRQVGPFAVKLMPDMMTLDGEQVKIEITGIEDHGHDFFEASSMRKIGGKYYFIYSSLNSHELCYAIGTAPLGPFAYGGILHDNGDIGLNDRTAEERVNYTGNNHGSLVEIGGKWYVFGHRQTNCTDFSRQGVAEQVTVLEDGSIPQAEMTSCGLNGGPLEGRGTYGAYIACTLRSKTGARHYVDANTDEKGMEIRNFHPMFTQEGEDRENDPNQYIAHMLDGAEAGFKYFRFDTAVPGKSPELRISAETRGAAGQFTVLDESGTVCADIPLAARDSWGESESVALRITPGVHAMFFRYEGEGSEDFRAFTIR